MGSTHLSVKSGQAEQISNWKAKLATLRPRAERALGGPKAFDQLAREFLDLLLDESALTYSVLFLVEWTRP